jgi:hypothetical protein
MAFPLFIVCVINNKAQDQLSFLSILKHLVFYRSREILFFITFYIFCKIYCLFGQMEAIYWVVAVLIMYFFSNMFENKTVQPLPELNYTLGYFYPEQTTKQIIPETIDSFGLEIRKLIHLNSGGSFQLPVPFNTADSLKYLESLGDDMDSDDDDDNIDNNVNAADSSLPSLPVGEGANKDGENKDGENKDGESKDGENKDGESKDDENKDGESKDGEKENKGGEKESKDGEKENKDDEKTDSTSDNKASSSNDDGNYDIKRVGDEIKMMRQELTKLQDKVK